MEELTFENPQEEINHWRILWEIENPHLGYLEFWLILLFSLSQSSNEYKSKLDDLTAKVRSILDDYESEIPSPHMKRVASDLSRMQMLAEKSHANVLVGTSDDDRTKMYPDDYLVSSRFQNKSIIVGKNFVCSALRNLNQIQEMRIYDGSGHHIIHSKWGGFVG